MLQPVLEDVVKRISYDNRKAYSANATELRKALNAPLIFEIAEEIPDGEKSKYAGCIVDICRPDALVDENWTAILDKDGRASLDATILGYMQAGIPTQLRLWNKGDDEFEKDPIMTQTFKVTEKVTTIVLGQKNQIEAQWFTGGWNRVYSDNTDSGNAEFDLFIEILDDTNCSYRFNYGGRPTTQYRTTTYSFDPAKRTLEMETYDLGDIVLTAYGKDEGEYGKDFIRSDFGERYVRVK